MMYVAQKNKQTDKNTHILSPITIQLIYKSHQPARRQGMLLKCPTNDHKNLKVFVAGILNKNIIESACTSNSYSFECNLGKTYTSEYYLVRRDLHTPKKDLKRISDDHGEKNEIGKTSSKILSHSSERWQKQ